MTGDLCTQRIGIDAALEGRCSLTLVTTSDPGVVPAYGQSAGPVATYVSAPA